MNGERPAGEQGERGVVPRPSPAMPALTIEKIETTALRVPLNRRSSGSAYSMTNRCTREGVDRDPIFWGLFANRPAITSGNYVLSEEPGFGIELDRDYIQRYTVGTRSTSR